MLDVTGADKFTYRS